MSGSDDQLNVGELRRHERLGSEALYRICELDRHYARVEVVEGPGLRTGQHFKFTRAAVARMQLVSAPEDSAPVARRESALRIATARKLLP